MRLIDADALKEQINIMQSLGASIPIMHMIENAPTMEPKHGHWTDNGHIGRRRWCSVCGGIAFEEYDDCGLAEVTETDYCPNCGAKMDEVEE